MSWKCPQCGVDGLDDGLGSCSCGYVRFPSGVAFTSDVTAKEVQMRVPTTFGQSSLKSLGDPDVKYVSSEQFKVEKRPDQGGWAILDVSWATNPLFLNGGPIPGEGAILKEGDKLSIKDKFFRLTVRLLA